MTCNKLKLKIICSSEGTAACLQYKGQKYYTQHLVAEQVEIFHGLTAHFIEYNFPLIYFKSRSKASKKDSEIEESVDCC